MSLVVIDEQLRRRSVLVNLAFCIAGAVLCIYGLTRIAAWASYPSVQASTVNLLVFVVLLGTLATIGVVVFIGQLALLFTLARRVEVQDGCVLVNRLFGKSVSLRTTRLTCYLRLPCLDLAAHTNVVFCYTFFVGFRCFSLVDRDRIPSRLLDAIAGVDKPTA